jgi:hypothetical protein
MEDSEARKWLEEILLLYDKVGDSLPEARRPLSKAVTRGAFVAFPPTQDNKD